MHQPVAAVRQHAQGVPGLGAAFGLHAVAGQMRGAGDRPPMQAASPSHAAFIHVHHRGLDQGADEGGGHGIQRVAGPRIGLAQGAPAQGLAKQVQTGLPQPVKGQELLGERMERESPEVRAVWDGSFHAGGEGSLPRQTRDGTWFDFGWVLGHGQARGRQIKDLAAFAIEPGLAGQGHAAARISARNGCRTALVNPTPM